MDNPIIPNSHGTPGIHAIHATKDPIAEKLALAAQYVLVVVFGLLPILFVPSIAAPFGYSKTFIVIVGLFVALILYGFSLLRSGNITLNFSVLLGLLWGVVLVAFVSAFLSGNIKHALLGDALGPQTAVFMLILALTATTWSFFGAHKFSVMRLFFLLSVSTIVLLVFHLIRLLLGAEWLSFGLFDNATQSLLGGWNDLAIFFGLIVIIAISALQQLPLRRLFKIITGVVILLSLMVLTVVNFTAVWIVLGIASLIAIIYNLLQGRGVQIAQVTQAAESTPSSPPNFGALIMSIVVLLLSFLFVLVGSTFSGTLSDRFGVSYVEVRPSFSATADIVQQVYTENAILGVGPNHFADAWRMHKNEAINTTAFWATDFESGIGYIPTMFATLGVLGGVLWVLFFLSYVGTGLRALVRSERKDKIWYFIGSSAFIGGLYIWVLTFVYVPGPVLLMLAAVCTGLVVAATTAVGSRPTKTFQLATSGGKGNIVLISIVTPLIIGSIAALYYLGNHYASVHAFNQGEYAVQTGADINTVEVMTVRAFNLFEDDRYARRIAEYQLARISNLLQVQEPTEEEQSRFLAAVENGSVAGNRAVALGGTNPDNWSVLGSVYFSLVPGDIEGAYDEALRALERARELDPKNPARVLALARLELAHGNTEGARDLATVAVRMKPDYRDGVFFLSQVQIALGDLDRAAESARGMTVLSPQNPVFHFQLGVIEMERGNTEVAIRSLERAVALDTQYANARYFLALAYDRVGRSEDARPQLERVLELNPGNQLILELLARLDSGESLDAPAAGEGGAQSDGSAPVSEDDQEGDVNASDVSEEDLDSPLISPVNNASGGGSGDSGSEGSGDSSEASPSADEADPVNLEETGAENTDSSETPE